MKEKLLHNHRAIKLTAYILFIIIVFALSLFTMPFEMFFLTSAVILVTLRSIEKELTSHPGRVKQ